MPRRTGTRPHKRGTNNTAQAAARDASRANALKQAADDALVALQAHAAAIPEAVEAPVVEARLPPQVDAVRRREAIIYMWKHLGAPPADQWDTYGGPLRMIADWLAGRDKITDLRPIRETLERHISGEDVRKQATGQGRKPKLTYGQQKVVADCLRAGTGQEQAAFIVKAWRESKGMTEEESAVSRQAVKTAVVKLGGVLQRRGTTSTGSRDPESKWATSRDAQAKQWKGQVVTPEETAAASAPGDTLTVEGRRVKTLAIDPLKLLTLDAVIIKVLGSTWPNQSQGDRKKRWPCKLCGGAAARQPHGAAPLEAV